MSGENIDVLVRRHSTVIERFDHLIQDSGNVSWLVTVDARQLFVKTAGAPSSGNHGGTGKADPLFGSVATRGRARRDLSWAPMSAPIAGASIWAEGRRFSVTRVAPSRKANGERRGADDRPGGCCRNLVCPECLGRL